MKSEQALREIRAKIFQYPNSKENQADRVLMYLKTRVLRSRAQGVEPVGPYSGLTRGELRKSGTCETDWY